MSVLLNVVQMLYALELWKRYTPTLLCTTKIGSVLSDEPSVTKELRQGCAIAVSYTHLDVYKRQVFRVCKYKVEFQIQLQGGVFFNLGYGYLFQNGKNGMLDKYL